MKSITGLEHGYNAKLEKYMRDNFNFKQISKGGHINLSNQYLISVLQ